MTYWTRGSPAPGLPAVLSTPPEERPAATSRPAEFGLRPPLDDHPESKHTPSDDDRGWAAWLVIVLLAAVTLRGLMLAFGGGAGEVAAVFTGGEPAVVSAADRATPGDPIGVDPETVAGITAGLDAISPGDGGSHAEAAAEASATPSDGYAMLLHGAAQLGLPAGAVVAVQSLLALGMIVLAFAIGRRFGGHDEEDAKSADRVGLIAAALVAVHPAVLRAGASLEPTLWSAAGVLLAVYLLTGVGKTRVRADGSNRRDWFGLLTRSCGAGLALAVAIAFGGVDEGLVYVLLAGLGVGLAWWVWQRERDHSRRKATPASDDAAASDPTAIAAASGWRRHTGVFAAAVVSAGLCVGVGGFVPGLIVSQGGDRAGLANDWQAGAATRLAWATHNPAATPGANAGAALAMVRGELETEPDRSAYAAADAVAWQAVREALGHASWRVQRDAWRAALMPASGEVVSGFGVEPTGYDRVAQWLGQKGDATDESGNNVLTVVGLLWAGLNAAVVLVAGLGLGLLIARRRWGEVVCLGLLLGVTLTALVLGEGTRGGVGVLGLIVCGWAASGVVLPRRAVVRRPKRRRKGQEGPAGIARAGGLLSVAMAVNPGDDDVDDGAGRSWRNLWGWWSPGDRDSDNYRAVRLPLTGGQGLPVASRPDEEDDAAVTEMEGEAGKAIAPGVELLEESVEEEVPLVAGGRPI
ncbi:MAG: hypothetical protein AAF797_11130 [Planctomycetota bacterium]